MGVGETSYGGMLLSIFLLFALPWCFAHGLEANQSALLTVDASPQSGQKIPDTLFGIFFETDKANHEFRQVDVWVRIMEGRVGVGSGSPKFGFEAGGPNTPSNIDPWSIIGQESFIYVSTDRTSCFPRNEVALRMEVLCDNTGSVICPSDGVGIYNPGYWGMNIEQGKTYKLILYVRSLNSINISVSLTSSDGLQKLASASILADASDVSNWTRVELLLESVATNMNSRLQLTTTNKGVIWFDQVSLMPSDTYKELAITMKWILPPSFLLYRHDVLDSIEFARGSSDSKWGSVRAGMGHPEPFQLEYVAIGNEDCGKKFYKGNYMKFYYAIKAAYPDIKIISNCDGSSRPLDHPADLYDFHVYTSARNLFSMTNHFDRTSRDGPKAFVSEYAVTGSDAGTGSLLASLGEAAFLIGLERNSDVVEMASYAPLFVNTNDRRWNPDAIVFNSWQQYGTPSYWMQLFFKESSGAIFHPTKIQASFSGAALVASTITWQDPADNSKYLKIKIVNFGSDTVNLKISVSGLEAAINSLGDTTVLTSGDLMDENSFDKPNKVMINENSIRSSQPQVSYQILERRWML
ncbi:hypothetical protein C4D60_Mb08t24340 [Musa balbisiana]|uniref:non-reducing end alpha-L-arabinofuranosidase n=1 Tax=Musa balbisiana TaxID=52838 RepID=A0A4S8K671_MUSBA|nr:hypothetical protein C4D60_Mb08t24340 [Musa balbisiana]